MKELLTDVGDLRGALINLMKANLMCKIAVSQY